MRCWCGVGVAHQHHWSSPRGLGRFDDPTGHHLFLFRVDVLALFVGSPEVVLLDGFRVTRVDLVANLICEAQTIVTNSVTKASNSETSSVVNSPSARSVKRRYSGNSRITSALSAPACNPAGLPSAKYNWQSPVISSDSVLSPSGISCLLVHSLPC